MMALATRDEVHERLQSIFPEGSSNRAYVTRMLAASTVFVALYIAAIEGSGTFLGPKHIYRMTDEQADKTSDAERGAYATDVLQSGRQIEGQRWYQDNTRAPIRDETLREGLVAIGAVVERTDLATTSSKPRYALTTSFAELFDPDITGEVLQELVTEAGFPIEHVAFVTAYLDRSGRPFTKTVDSLAWGSYAWFAAEPERLVLFSEKLRRLTGRT